MIKIRKGSIVWDKLTKEKAKVLTSPNTGELPDNLCKVTGLKYHPSMKGSVLICTNEITSYTMTHNNRPCTIRNAELHLILYSEYLNSLN